MSTGVLALIVVSAMVSDVRAQRGRGAGPGAGPGQPASSARAAAPIDLTGYWVAIINEDWRWRMVTPPAKDYASVPLNAEGRRVADTWDVSKDGSCLAYGAAGLMRMPTRLHITWENDSTLRIDTDSGQQTRRLVFGSATVPAEPSLQGFSAAAWERPGRAGGPGGFGGPPPGGAPRAGGAAQPSRGGNLKVTTTHLSPGWLRRNGVPYSENTTLTEYFDRFTTPAGEVWFVVTTIVDDPKYLTQPFVTSSHFRQEPDVTKWDPIACKP
jgi:hypothetical protein